MANEICFGGPLYLIVEAIYGDEGKKFKYLCDKLCYLFKPQHIDMSPSLS